MKNIFLLFLLIVTPLAAQTIVPIEQQKTYLHNGIGNTNYYFKDVNDVYNKFLGNWKYQDNFVNPTEIVEVVFYKDENHDFSGNYFEDRIYARFKYIKNGQIIFNTLNSDDNSSRLLINGGFFSYPFDISKISLTYYEPDEERWKRKSRLYLKYLPGSPNKLEWKMEWEPLDENVPAPKMPIEMILTKMP